MFKKAVLLFLFSSVIGHAQGIINEQSESDISNGLIREQQEINFITQQTRITAPGNLVLADNSGVFINQIGDNNLANIDTEAQFADVQLNQIGDLNSISLDLRAEIINYQVQQQGTNNRLLELQSFGGKQLIERNIIQNGNSQNLIIHGRNSIVDKLRITMEGGSQNLIIRNSN